MAPRSVTYTLARATRKVPGLRRVPIGILIGAAEVGLMARDHLRQLTPDERRRLTELVREGRGRPTRLQARDRRELEQLLDKLQARALFGEAALRMSPVPLPRRLVLGPRRARRR